MCLKKCLLALGLFSVLFLWGCASHNMAVNTHPTQSSQSPLLLLDDEAPVQNKDGDFDEHEYRFEVYSFRWRE